MIGKEMKQKRIWKMKNSISFEIKLGQYAPVKIFVAVPPFPKEKYRLILVPVAD